MELPEGNIVMNDKMQANAAGVMIELRVAEALYGRGIGIWQQRHSILLRYVGPSSYVRSRPTRV